MFVTFTTFTYVFCTWTFLLSLIFEMLTLSI